MNFVKTAATLGLETELCTLQAERYGPAPGCQGPGPTVPASPHHADPEGAPNILVRKGLETVISLNYNTNF